MLTDPKSWGPLESHGSKVQVREFPSITSRLPSGGSVMLASPSVPCHPQTCVNAKLVDGAQGAFFLKRLNCELVNFCLCSVTLKDLNMFRVKRLSQYLCLSDRPATLASSESCLEGQTHRFFSRSTRSDLPFNMMPLDE